MFITSWRTSRVLILASCLLFVSKILLSASIFPNQVFPVGTLPVDLFIFDFNGDGFLDIATANFSSSDISILQGNGSGTFDPDIRIPTRSSFSTVWDDFNSDGWPDFAQVSREPGTGDGILSVFLAEGNGVFVLKAEYSVGNRPTTISSGHISGDPHVDLAITISATDNVSLFFGNGDGAFDFMGNLPTGDSPIFVTLADLNEDGLDDFVVANRVSGSITLHFSDGFGGSDESVEMPAGEGPLFVLIDDLDMNNHNDIIVANIGSDDLSIFWGLGRGLFSSETRQPAGLTPNSLATLDFDQDGVLDIGVINGCANPICFQGAVSILRGDGAGGFLQDTPIVVGHEPRRILAQDFDNNGWKDLAVTNLDSDDVTILLVGEDGFFPRPRNEIDIGGIPFSIASIRNDLVSLPSLAVGISGPEILFLDNNGLGDFSLGKRLRISEIPWVLDSADFNHDGRTDLISVDTVWMNKKIGTFEERSLNYSGSSPVALAVGMFDRNSLLDLVISNRGSRDVSVFSGKGNGNFHPDVRIPTEGRSQGVGVADFNSDGFEDIAVANFDTNSVGLLIGKGNGTFDPAIQFPAGLSPTSLAVADFNHDDIPDVAVVNQNSQDVSILMGAAGGQFAPEYRIQAGREPSFILANDWDRDENDDLVVSNTKNNSFSLFLGDGAGGFSREKRFRTGPGPYCILTDDFDGDGFLDIAVCDISFKKISIHLNRTP